MEVSRENKGNYDEIGKSRRRRILAQPKGMKLREYFAYFLHGWGKKRALQPQMIYPEVSEKEENHS